MARRQFVGADTMLARQLLDGREPRFDRVLAAWVDFQRVQIAREFAGRVAQLAGSRLDRRYQRRQRRIVRGRGAHRTECA